MKTKQLIAGMLGLGLGAVVLLSTPSCSNSGQTSDHCIGCQILNCKDNQLDSWCLVDITDAAHSCHFEQSFGYCLTVPDGGFAPSANITNWVWQIMSNLVRPMISDKWGNNVGYDVLECKVAVQNPYFGQFNTNAVSGKLLGSITIKNPDGGFYITDETQCEACAAAACDLNDCGADANCSCWVGCAFQDATLASCPEICGPQGGVTTSLAQCLVNSCGGACGVPGAQMATCSSNPVTTGVGGSSTTGCTLQQGGMDCAEDADCCSGFCIGASGELMGTCA